MKNKRKKEKYWIISIILFLLFIYANERRSFYYTEEGKCFTVWKTIDDCFIMPYKYYGLLKPSDNYIKTSKTASVDIFWIDSLPNNLIIRACDYRHSFYVKIMNNKPKKFILHNYYDDEEKYRRMLFKEDLNGKDYLNGIDIDIASNRLIRQYLSSKNQEKINNQLKNKQK
jgi:hypothetical protein